jgi:hypothetical protein
MAKNISKKGKQISSPIYSLRELEIIRKKAYFIWESKGWPQNSALSDWLEAEEAYKKGN